MVCFSLTCPKISSNCIITADIRLSVTNTVETNYMVQIKAEVLLIRGIFMTLYGHNQLNIDDKVVATRP